MMSFLLDFSLSSLLSPPLPPMGVELLANGLGWAEGGCACREDTSFLG